MTAGQMTGPLPPGLKRTQPPDTGGGPHRPHRVGAGALDPQQLWRALPEALRKLNPVSLVRNPVMFVTEVGAALTTGLAVSHSTLFSWLITVWLWLTVVFANLAEAVAESRGKAQADSLRKTRQQTTARRLVDWSAEREARDGAFGEEEVSAAQLQRGDFVVVEADQLIPGDGDVVPAILTRSQRRGQRRRVGDHRGVGAGDPRVRWRPLRGHRRHPGAVRPDRGADHPAAR
jgi:K+-transporting ATPase ATPase B chain